MMLEAARQYVAAGLSVIPVLLDGTKKPLIPWKAYQSRQATEQELGRWFWARQAGIAIVCGRVSGGLEVLDFDDPGVFEQWLALAREQIPLTLARLTLVRTPSGGAHAYYRVQPWPGQGNRKLARARDGAVLIETRAEGGYVLAPPCPGYRHLGGPPLTNPGTIGDINGGA